MTTIIMEYLSIFFGSLTSPDYHGFVFLSNKNKISEVENADFYMCSKSRVIIGAVLFYFSNFLFIVNVISFQACVSVA